MKTIILDTDFILTSVKFKIDIKEQLKQLCDFNFNISYLDKTLDELKNKPNENLAKTLISNFNIIKTTRDKSVDELILDISNSNTIIATQDKELKEKLKKGKIAVITIRQKKYLVFA
ncbi:hypothetical protein HYV88_03000 [Candidatus Woesearchaeota archaeon]|nr:hypothetical protein [Candidatus Woesearchaeota archaeon]